MKRSLLVIALGIAFLIVITWLGTFVTTYVVPRTTSQTQHVEVAAYTVTLHVNPNPPPIDQPVTLSIQILQTATNQPVSDASVSIDGTMVTMDMGTTHVQAQARNSGNYVAQMNFAMIGPWQVQVLFLLPEQPVLNAAFTISTQ